MTTLTANITPRTIIKRDGSNEPFFPGKITFALEKCFASLPHGPCTPISELTQRAVNLVAAKYEDDVPSVENVQDIVEMVLQGAGEFYAAKHYILYRAEHNKDRDTRPIPQEIREAFAQSKQYFPTPLQEFQFYDKYSRWNAAMGTRETWPETVERATSFLADLVMDSGGILEPLVWSRIEQAILNMEAMPSMRLLAMAGPAAVRQNAAIYNCSYIPVDGVEAFSEALLISMSGCGVGFSVESKYVENFNRVRRQNGMKSDLFIVDDSTEGWVQAVDYGISRWLDGGDVQYDFSQVRAAGAVLRTKGGRASGPEPLRAALAFTRSRILARQGTFLRPIDAHDIMCAIGNAAVSGGVRRTAMISLFDYDDAEMWHCKDGDFERDNSQRWNANNSVVWPDAGISQVEFATQFLEMVRSGRGEPGIFNRNAPVPGRRSDGGMAYGTNPCGEIILRPWEFCNLSIVVARHDDTLETLTKKVEIATTIGTIQSLATHFPGLRPQWKENAEAERLLGVDITGQLDCPVASNPDNKAYLRSVAIETNRMVAQQLGINPSAAITTVKPSGNSSQLLNCSSGLHARWSPYYIRNVRVSATSPLFKVLRDVGAPMDPENGQIPETANTWVIHFPVASPPGAITRDQMSAIDQCEYWLNNKVNWTEHNPSVTITYKPDEVIALMQWVWECRDLIGGMAFLPAYDAKYDQLPYIEITKEEYERLNAAFPGIDFAKIYRYEEEDMTTAAQELACMAGACEI